MENFEELKFVFYITFQEKLPPYYYQLAASLREQDLTLVPIQLDQLLMLHQGKKRIHAICIVTNLKERKAFKKAQRILKQAVVNHLVSLYQLSSYSDINFQNKLGSLKNYHFAQLPLRYSVLAEAIYKFYQSEIKSSGKWIGGNRARLSFEIMGDN